MKLSLYINQEKALEWGLSGSECFLVDLFSHLPKWADSHTVIDEEIWYFFAKPKILKEAPILGDKVDTVYRLCRKLEEKGLIEWKKIGNRDYWRLTKKIKEWDFEGREDDENENSEKNPSLGKNSEGRKKIRANSEKNPTDKNTIGLDNIILSSSLRSEDNISREEKKNEDGENQNFDLTKESEIENEKEFDLETEKVSAGSRRAVPTGGTISDREDVSGRPKTSIEAINERRANIITWLRNQVGVDKFKDYSEWQEAIRIEHLVKRIGKETFLERLRQVLDDPYKLKRCNQLSYLRKEIESFIHTDNSFVGIA